MELSTVKIYLNLARRDDTPLLYADPIFLLSKEVLNLQGQITMMQEHIKKLSDEVTVLRFNTDKKSPHHLR